MTSNSGEDATFLLTGNLDALDQDQGFDFEEHEAQNDSDDPEYNPESPRDRPQRGGAGAEDDATAPAPAKKHKGPPARFNDKKRTSNREAAKRHRDKKRKELQDLERTAVALRAEVSQLKTRLAEYGVLVQDSVPRATSAPAHEDEEEEDEEEKGPDTRKRRRNPDEDADEQARMDKKRHLCALAAKKCREKKRVYTGQLEVEVEGLRSLTAQIKTRIAVEELKRASFATLNAFNTYDPTALLTGQPVNLNFNLGPF